MAREYDHLFKLLIIGDSGKPGLLPLIARARPPLTSPSLCPFRSGEKQSVAAVLRQPFLR